MSNEKYIQFDNEIVLKNLDIDLVERQQYVFRFTRGCGSSLNGRRPFTRIDFLHAYIAAHLRRGAGHQDVTIIHDSNVLLKAQDTV